MRFRTIAFCLALTTAPAMARDTVGPAVQPQPNLHAVGTETSVAEVMPSQVRAVTGVNRGAGWQAQLLELQLRYQAYLMSVAPAPDAFTPPDL